MLVAHCTVKVTELVVASVPDVPVTVTVYVPEVVPGFGGVLGPLEHPDTEAT